MKTRRNFPSAPQKDPGRQLVIGDMRRFADWHQMKEWVFVEGDHSEDVIFLERGYPKYALMELVGVLEGTTWCVDDISRRGGK